ncbi:MAG: OmpA family protein, partial [Ignavibacteria bacterium]|nr:OmpA family protein [Ignavibacteria bacterium]
TISETVTENDETIVKTIRINRRDTIFTYHEKKLQARLELFAIDSLGNKIKNPKIRIEEFVATRMEPLLNYVFFDHGSDQIPKRYVTITSKDLDKFIVDSLYKNSTLDIYYHLLNIIGKRLKEYPDAKIKIVGCNSNVGIEKGNLELSKRRAESVKRYLVDVGNIDPKRIEVSFQNLPNKSSTPFQNELKAEENRRVEIYSNHPEILKPVTITTFERKSSFDKIGYTIEITADTNIDEYRVELFVGSDTAFSFKGRGGKSFTSSSEVDFSQVIFRSYISQIKKIIGNLVVKDVFDRITVSKDSLTNFEAISYVKEKELTEGAYKIDYYRLILFDFDKWNIEGKNRWIVEYIKIKVSPSSSVEIIGSTDLTGEVENNKTLSQKRAESVRQALGIPNAKAIGLGEAKLEFPNELPEGRFYSRNVVIVIRKRIK